MPIFCTGETWTRQGQQPALHLLPARSDVIASLCQPRQHTASTLGLEAQHKTQCIHSSAIVMLLCWGLQYTFKDNKHCVISSKGGMLAVWAGIHSKISGGEPHRSAIKDALPGAAAVNGPEQAAGAVGQLAALALGRSADGEPPAAKINIRGLLHLHQTLQIDI